MSRRLELHEVLCDILGSEHVYFQPPESVTMTYPAIVYSLDDMPSRHADDRVYLLGDRYQVILIDKDPDNTTREKLAMLPTSQFNRYYAQDNLNHYVFTLYY